MTDILAFVLFVFSTVYNKLQHSPHIIIPSINILIPFHLHWGINIQQAVQFSSTPCRYYTDAFFHIQWTFNHLQDGPGTHKALMVVWRCGSCSELSSGLTIQDGWAHTMAVSVTRFSRKQFWGLYGVNSGGLSDWGRMGEGWDKCPLIQSLPKRSFVLNWDEWGACLSDWLIEHTGGGGCLEIELRDPSRSWWGRRLTRENKTGNTWWSKKMRSSRFFWFLKTNCYLRKWFLGSQSVWKTPFSCFITVLIQLALSKSKYQHLHTYMQQLIKILSTALMKG